ncbi:HTH domain-containing protein [Gemmobacter aquatilis]|uniref:HTH domain-containing protein n=1 Tax=Gemmobacter aquatilis TaxID=933059 RepID=A0A1H8GTQ9_9RHOB|nr:HTH domain-containing protein [Gemmobacter aquatilis]SEN47245.1 HTH domain-containing protein [Gemmobacter aquatilis]
MSRNDRLFDLVQILRDGRLHRSSDLAQRLGVSTRTIWRDMAVLAGSGLPVEGERGVGYILRAPVTLPPLILTIDELAVLQQFLAATSEAPEGTLPRGARSLAAKIAAVLPQVAEDPA